MGVVIRLCGWAVCLISFFVCNSTGRASLPRVVAGHLEMLEIVERYPGAIGYAAKEFFKVASKNLYFVAILPCVATIVATQGRFLLLFSPFHAITEQYIITVTAYKYRYHFIGAI